jgi:hypothetical protein
VNRVERISSLIGEVAFPLLGYFFWNWNLYFILLFFLLDQISRTIFLPQRLKLIENTKAEKYKTFFLQFLLLILEIMVIHVAVYIHQNEINFTSEFLNFITYKEMGIAQGILLIPLILISEWIRIKNELKLGIFGNKQQEIINKHKRNSYLRISFFAILVALQNEFFIPEVTLVILFLGFLAVLVYFK